MDDSAERRVRTVIQLKSEKTCPSCNFGMVLVTCHRIRISATWWKREGEGGGEDSSSGESPAHVP